jgi:hypothetical protein
MSAYLLCVNHLPHVVVVSLDEAKRRAAAYMVKELSLEIEVYRQPGSNKWIYDYTACDWREETTGDTTSVRSRCRCFSIR